MTTTNLWLDPTLREELRSQLRAARAALLRTVAMTEEELATLESREPGAPIEDAAREEMIGILARLDERERLEAEEVEAALARLSTGTYGVCQTCGGRLPVPRLRAMPATRFCLTCQATREGRGGSAASGQS